MILNMNFNVVLNQYMFMGLLSHNTILNLSQFDIYFLK